MLVKKLIFADAILLVLYAAFSVLRISRYLSANLTSAPTWFNYVGLAVECLLIAAVLIAAYFISAKLPSGELHIAARIALIVGFAAIAAIGFILTFKAVSAASDKLLIGLCGALHTLLYIGLFLTAAQFLRFFIKKA